MYRTRQPRYTIPHICGHRQVVRHQLPKLTLAGSSPVARSKKAKARHHHGAVLFFNKAPGLEPARVRALSKREAFVASRRRRRQAPEAGADLRSKYADVPLPAPPSTGDLGNVGSNPLCPCMCADRACRSQPVRICEANAQTSRCPLHQPRSISGTTDSTGFALASPRTQVCRPQPVRICEANTRMSPRPLQFQNVRLMPAAHTRTRARYNG